MKERPIIFTPSNAQKCFDRQKTQTRRIIKWPDWARPEECAILLQNNPSGISYYEGGSLRNRMTCPFGVVGDRLWIREAYCVGKPAIPSGIGIIPYYGKLKDCPDSEKTKVVYQGKWGKLDPPKWRPSIHMPRWASRTVVELTEVRVERLQSITEEDAIAEGMDARSPLKEPRPGSIMSSPYHTARFPIAQFALLWESIYGPGSWNRNPWVWCLTFRKVGATNA